jgi:integrase
MRTRTKGIQLDKDGGRIVNKEHKGVRIFQRLGKVSQEDAESWLRDQQARIDAQRIDAARKGADRLWASAAEKYLDECEQKKVRTLDMIARHVEDLLPYIGTAPLRELCNDSVAQFKADRLAKGKNGKPCKPSSVNRTLEVLRTTLIRASRVWRDNGKPWLAAPPLIEMLDEAASKRAPYPISWQEQAKFLPRLPKHLADMVEFSLNTGARDENVCGLRWEWEVRVPELKRSVFIIPADAFKSGRRHVLILNDVAWAIVKKKRGEHPDYVFTYTPRGKDKKPRRVESQNNTAFQKARRDVGLPHVRVHDLRHTFGQRLRDAGVPEEDRSLLLGHAVQGMAQHYAAATLERLLEAANSVLTQRDRTMVLRVVGR